MWSLVRIQSPRLMKRLGNLMIAEPFSFVGFENMGRALQADESTVKSTESESVAGGALSPPSASESSAFCVCHGNFIGFGLSGPIFFIPLFSLFRNNGRNEDTCIGDRRPGAFRQPDTGVLSPADGVCLYSAR